MIRPEVKINGHKQYMFNAKKLIIAIEACLKCE